MYPPVSTYRIQFNKAFTLRDLKEHSKYFALLGVGSVYASPIFSAVPGSTHHYDVTDPCRISREIGHFNEFRELVRQLKDRTIGWIQDVVPNHMAFHMDNHRLWDVLEKGRLSEYAGFFDIDFHHDSLRDKLMLPVLEETITQAIDRGHLKLGWNKGSFTLNYLDQAFPLNFETFRWLLGDFHASIPESVSHEIMDFRLDQRVADSYFLNHIWPPYKSKLEEIYRHKHSFQSFIRQVSTRINSEKKNLLDLASRQHYQFCHWQETNKRINYRRFFTINHLICTRMEKKEVFAQYHQLVRQMVDEGLIQGLRIDHIDGLYDPSLYLTWLRELAGKGVYVVTEKILEENEQIPSDWTVAGTTGYDFLATVNNLFTYGKNYKTLLKIYHSFGQVSLHPERIIHSSKKFILDEYMQGEWNNLTRMFRDGGFLPEGHRFIKMPELKKAIGELLVSFPVYRLYATNLPLDEHGKQMVLKAIEKARKNHPEARDVLKILQDLFLGRYPLSDRQKQGLAGFFKRCMQYTGPLMAKGVEDTAMYQYNCMLAHNEVGDSPGSQGISVDVFHQRMIWRQKSMPLSMNTTSTHDTKRGEDVRARLNLISEQPHEWREHLTRWAQMNHKFRAQLNDAPVPSGNEEYFIYQTLVGIYPSDGSAEENFQERVKGYMIKALREAKVNSQWNQPNPEYENGVLEFLQSILSPNHGFLKDFIPYVQKIADFGRINGLSQLILKFTCPGIPDVYQGTELWDLSLGDPDNRRAVDFSYRYDSLSGILNRKQQDPTSMIRALIKERSNGNMKLWFTYELFQARKQYPDLLSAGKYIPLKTRGRFQEHLCAFLRNHGQQWMLVVVPLFPTLLKAEDAGSLFDGFDWEDTFIGLPEGTPHQWTNMLTGQAVDDAEFLSVKTLCPLLPFGIFHGMRPASPRKSGILLHVSSLPGKYGIGDLGEEARSFLDFLADASQKYWQVLPLNPVSARAGYSPYSSVSCFAGNVLLISPERLSAGGLVTPDELASADFSDSSQVEYLKVASYREDLINRAFQRFETHRGSQMEKDFGQFCQKEAYWLDNYALFQAIKDEFNDAPWCQWPVGLRDRKKEDLAAFVSHHPRAIRKIQFAQFLFHRQWNDLKAFANGLGIGIIGDMPFYVAYDSADVWVHPYMFKLKEDKLMEYISGVPPDYFSEEGQLWNMPVFDWQGQKEAVFDWWVKRIAKHLEWYDRLRIDHFRGFSSYWEVPADRITAIHGRWKAGPGVDFLERLRREFPEMPFVAEDLGDIDDPVIHLRNEFNLPGMHVLQFAFGRDLPDSIHVPHNHSFNSVVYTSTHDNNTVKGWFKHELGQAERKRLNRYTGEALSPASCNRHMIRMAYGSASKLAIIAMQDFLELDQEARMNNPASPGGNWLWKLRSDDLDGGLAERIHELVVLFGRK